MTTRPTAELKTGTVESELKFERYFTKEGTKPFDEIKWELRDAEIADAAGKVIFSQKNVEVPSTWSQQAVKIAVSKYFRGQLGTANRETSVKQLVGRVSKTMADWGRQGNYFSGEEEAQAFEDELTYILVNQLAAFNSPVWFNVGIEKHPQCSACFINSLKDDMKSILNLTVTEGMLFKYGSGTGTNFSVLRSSREHLSFSTGKASGPVSFMKGFDAFAGVIKSGGRTRRAAKMVILNIDHPDVVEFVNCKANEEKKAWALIEAGYDPSVDGEAYGSVYFQNANHSVRVTDEFMDAVEKNGGWTTHMVTTGEKADTYQAKDLFRQISEAAWICGDPGLQFDTTINKWHTCPNTDRINASNPCSEYMFLDDTSCNLASLNLMKFRMPNGAFDVESFRRAVRVIITAMEIIIDNASYPTEAITRNSHDFRPLGIGYANLGALLMSEGLAYDSEEGRNFAAAITALMSGYAYYTSTLMAKKQGAFKGYAVNEKPFLNVISMHRDAAYSIPDCIQPDLLEEAGRAWDLALESGKNNGFRNSQISVLAPTGTIGFLMDCDTTGVEPDIALIKYKWLVGGGLMKIVNMTVPLALEKMGYKKNEITDIMQFLNEHETIEGAPHLKKEHLDVFDCAFKASKGTRSIHYLGHVRMMSAVQPFISGAISKTVNLQADATAEDIENAYMEAWKGGLKAIAIYRDGSKRTQPLTTSSGKQKGEAAAGKERIIYRPMRERLSDERRAITHKFNVAGHEGYITVGLYEDGRPGEIFVTMAKEGSTISGMMDAFSTAISIAMQYGVPLKVLAKKFSNMRFEPSGVTTNEQIRFAKSIMDYLFKWLAFKFLGDDDLEELGLNPDERNTTQTKLDENAKDTPAGKVHPQYSESGVPAEKILKDESKVRFIPSDSVGDKGVTKSFENQSDAPLCDDCGSIMVRSGSCYKCFNCGSTSGCS
jgi:ribonucleoside-diphosphate reductase alpha chain